MKRAEHVLSPSDEIAIAECPPALLDHFVERALGFFWLACLDPSQPVRNAMHMSVDTDVVLATERENHHQVRGLTSHSWQRDELVQRAGDLAVEPFDQRLGCRPHEARLVAIEADRVDQRLDLFDGQLRDYSRL